MMPVYVIPGIHQEPILTYAPQNMYIMKWRSDVLDTRELWTRNTTKGMRVM